MVEFRITGLDSVIDKLNSVDLDAMILQVATTLKSEIRRRVHTEGLASDGSPIGTYTPEYMKVRTGDFGNSGKVSKGANKGKLKDSGTFSRGKNAGNARPKYNRDGSTKVILSLTREMENDMRGTEPIKIEGGYGIGFTNDFNYDKAMWVEKTYKKPIWNLTESEKKTAEEVVHNYLVNLGLID